MKGFGNMMKEAQKLQQQMAALQEEVGKRTVEATVGGGMVTVVANGKQELVSIKIDPEVVSKDDVQKLQSLYQDDPDGLVLAPYAKLKNKIAATAWNEPAYDQNQDANFNKVDPGHGYVMTCTKFDKGALSKFRDKRRNKAGERYTSVSDMQPGQ